MLVYLLINLLLYSTQCQILIEQTDIYLNQGIVRGKIKYVTGKPGGISDF